MQRREVKINTVQSGYNNGREVKRGQRIQIINALEGLLDGKAHSTWKVRGALEKSVCSVVKDI